MKKKYLHKNTEKKNHANKYLLASALNLFNFSIERRLSGRSFMVISFTTSRYQTSYLDEYQGIGTKLEYNRIVFGETVSIKHNISKV